ncbi:hypothetical protein Q428_11510 [Fervidicella metallireducens AeB]|uniref:DUF2953 domain-containing protein n=1 Tax=Fervidicella metallireducens AeB TaxID=1403537 RepID=A0A017RT37_9CLOT|nr:hypothetical protein [Fervidicella metallireducens]EYE87781.1 hypothetical protein Q428_11510 [Fervidicella metallireducens AeB]
MTIILVILIIIVLFCVMNIRIVVEFQRKRLDFLLILYGFIKIKIKTIDFNKPSKKGKKIRKKLNFQRDKFIEFIKLTLQNFKYFISKCELRTNIKLDLGLSSPDKTAYVFGLINFFVYGSENILRYYFKNYSGKYEIYPDFKNKKLTYAGNITISVYFIPLLFFVFRQSKIIFKYRNYLFKKEEKNYVKSSNRGLNENNNG